MSSEILVPSAGESVNEGELAVWHKQDGDSVATDEVVAEVETEKASLEIRSPVDGVLNVLVKEGTTVNVGQKIATVKEGAGNSAPKSESKSATKSSSQNSGEPKVENVAATSNLGNSGGSAAQSEAVKQEQFASSKKDAHGEVSSLHATLSARKLMTENNLTKEDITSTKSPGRVSKEDVQSYLEKGNQGARSGSDDERKPALLGERMVERHRMTRLRQTISKRLTLANQTAALLTTFNEIDMSAVMQLRKQYKEKFKETYGVGLGFMSFFTKAACDALKLFPVVNSFIDGEDIVTHHYADIGIAVSTPKGLVVPQLRNAEKMGFVEIEKTILDFAKRGKDGKIALDEMAGGTFTITNGGIFGSMLSTPIVNFPQSAILGMHNIVERPVAVNGQVEIRPIMYVALTYDHRLIDGAEAVRFLYTIKERIEDPSRLLIGV